jgi:hypothetical protein
MLTLKEEAKEFCLIRSIFGRNNVERDGERGGLRE